MCLYVKFLVLLSGVKLQTRSSHLFMKSYAEISHTLWYMVFLVVI